MVFLEYHYWLFSIVAIIVVNRVICPDRAVNTVICTVTKAKWYPKKGLNFPGHTSTFASVPAAELSKSVDNSFTFEVVGVLDGKAVLILL